MSELDPRLNDKSVFPDPVYKETVLKPLFDGAKTHHVASFRRIDRAHLVMLTETGILDAGQASAIANALEQIDRDVDPITLVYTGEVEDFFFLIEKELKAVWDLILPDDYTLRVHAMISTTHYSSSALKSILMYCWQNHASA